MLGFHSAPCLCPAVSQYKFAISSKTFKKVLYSLIQSWSKVLVYIEKLNRRCSVSVKQYNIPAVYQGI